ncbi:MAG: prohibitin family protein [Limisphaerales bacterium]
MSSRHYREVKTITIDPRSVMLTAGAGIILFAILILLGAGTYVVQPGYRGVEVRLGKPVDQFRSEGLGFKVPFVSTIYPMSIRQRTREMSAECYSSDLQQVRMQLRVLYRIPEQAVVTIFREYRGDPFEVLISPRVEEALKEVAATRSAELIVKQREEVKTLALALARKKVGESLLNIADLVLYDIRLSPELEQAIELKMVQEQEASKAKFTQLKTQIEAETVVIRARGESEAIEIRGDALKDSPGFIRLQLVEKWDGRSPLVVGEGGGGVLLTPGAPARTSAPGGGSGGRR